MSEVQSSEAAVSAPVVSTPAKAKAKASKASAPSRKSVRFVTIGSKGTFCWNGTADAEGNIFPTQQHNGNAFKDAGAALQAVHVSGEAFCFAWKGNGAESVLGKSIGAWVSVAGGSVRILPLSVALGRKLLVSYKLIADGEKVTAHLPKANYASVKFPQILGTDCKLGRIENYRKAVKSGTSAKDKAKAQAGTQRDEIALA